MTGKIVLLLLIAFGGLSDAALHCYSCQSNCDGSNEVDMDCVSDDLDRCLVSEIAGTKIKSCSLQTGMEWVACVQGKLGQTGDCIRSTVGEVATHMAECTAPASVMNNTSVAGDQPRQDEPYVLCLCSSNLCNTDDLLKGEDGGESSSTPGGEASSTSGDGGNSTPVGEGSSTPGGDGSSTPGGDASSTPVGESSSTPGEGGEDGSGTSGVSAVAVALSGIILLMTNRLFN